MTYEYPDSQVFEVVGLLENANIYLDGSSNSPSSDLDFDKVIPITDTAWVIKQDGINTLTELYRERSTKRLFVYEWDKVFEVVKR